MKIVRYLKIICMFVVTYPGLSMFATLIMANVEMLWHLHLKNDLLQDDNMIGINWGKYLNIPIVDYNVILIDHTTTVSGCLSQAARLCTMVVFPVPVSPTRRTGSLNFIEHATLSRTSNARRISAKGPFWINAYTFEANSQQTNESPTKMY